MRDIVAQVQRVDDLLGEISSATVQQTAGIGQVSNAVTQLDHVTQQNAALVEESAAAAASLNQQANTLVAAVAGFKLAPAAA
jgi:methyl-accepting chemotaxis protein